MKSAKDAALQVKSFRYKTENSTTVTTPEPFLQCPFRSPMYSY